VRRPTADDVSAVLVDQARILRAKYPALFAHADRLAALPRNDDHQRWPKGNMMTPTEPNEPAEAAEAEPTNTGDEAAFGVDTDTNTDGDDDAGDGE